MLGLIGGTGLVQLFGGDAQNRHAVTTPFGSPSDAIYETRLENLPVLLLARHGPGHLLNPTQVPYRANIFALKQLGCTHILASGAVGSLRQEFKPRDLAICDQLIDRTSQRAGNFFESTAVHVEFADPFCPVLRRVLLDAARSDPPSYAVHDGGCYLCMEGPNFSTRAESQMHRLWGADLVGMTACPEAKLARQAELPYALLGLVTDYDCWKTKPGESATLSEITANLEAASANAMDLIRRCLRKIASEPAVLESSKSTALKQAIWSDKSKIAAEEIQKLSALWGGYFG